MTTSTSIQQLNRELGDKALAESMQYPRAYPGKFVGIANGQVVVVTNSLSELVRRLKQVEADPTKTYGVEIGRDYDKVYEIWEIR